MDLFKSHKQGNLLLIGHRLDDLINIVRTEAGLSERDCRHKGQGDNRNQLISHTHILQSFSRQPTVSKKPFYSSANYYLFTKITIIIQEFRIFE